MDAIDRYLERLNEPGLRDRLREMYHVDEAEGSRGVATEAQVAAAERELGIRLPPSYKKLVTTLSPYDGGYEVYGIADPDQLSADIVTASGKGESEYYPPFLIGVVPCPNGDIYCFDTRYPDKRGEYPIVLFDHEVHSAESEDWTKFETVASDLGEFLLGSLPGEAAEETKKGPPRIWELPASTVLRKGKSFIKRRLDRASRFVGSTSAAVRKGFGAPAAPTPKPGDREWLRKKMSPLLAAVDADDLQTAAELLSSGADPNAVSHSSTPLNWAISFKSREMVLLLLENGADLRALHSYESCFEIAYKRDPAFGGWLLAQAPDATVLEAAEGGTLDDVRRLLDAGGDANMISNDVRRRSPLHAAVARTDLEMAALLIDRGADLVGRGSGYPVLFVAAAHNYSAKMTDLLLRRGANLNATDAEGSTPLFAVAGSVAFDVLERLIQGGADVNFREPGGSTPLHAAARNTDAEGRAIRILIKHGANPNAQDDLGYTPLHVAMEHAHAGSAMTLLELGADRTICDQEGRTPVQLLSESSRLYPGMPEVVRRIGQAAQA
jgi:ankyrin repeat protein